jgi:hypothetical protein
MPYHQVPRARGGDATTEDRLPPTVRHTFQRLRMVGLSATEAGNLTAHLNGLRVGSQPWTVTEIERLLFLRVLVGSGRIKG